MDSIYVALISGFAGALIGSVSSVVTIYIQARSQERLERLRLATTLGLEDYRISRDHAVKEPGYKFVLPMATYVDWNFRVLLACSCGPLTPEKVARLRHENRLVCDAFKADQ